MPQQRPSAAVLHLPRAEFGGKVLLARAQARL